MALRSLVSRLLGQSGAVPAPEPGLPAVRLAPVARAIEPMLPAGSASQAASGRADAHGPGAAAEVAALDEHAAATAAAASEAAAEIVLESAVPAAAAGGLVGSVEAIQADGASGWVHDRSVPGIPLAVAAFLGTDRLAAATADLYRADLEASTGHGAHGFRLDFAPPVAPALLDHVQIVAVSRGRPHVIRARDPRLDDPARATDEAATPLFIIGNAPEASAMLAGCLIHTLGFSGPPQGHLLPLAQQLNRTVNKFYRMGRAAAGPDAMIRHVDAAQLQRGIRRVFIDAMASLYPDGRWVDNTPGFAAIQSALLSRTIWPKARFIFVASRMMESVAGHVANEPARPAREHVNGWVREMQLWSETRDRLGSAALTLDQQVLRDGPDAAARTLARFLTLEDDEAADLALALSDAAGSAAAAPSLDLGAWRGQDAEGARAAAAPMMEHFGYHWDETA